MRVSKKTDYALRALFTLVDHFGGAPIPIRELARRNDVPKRFLEQRCSQEPVCRFRRVFYDARNYVNDLMGRATLAEVAKGAPMSRQEIFSGFMGGEGI
jgi:DNA-binding IscR family transcriptional regulator